MCQPVNNAEQSVKEGGAYGVLPYMAPEVLCGYQYIKAVDIYSFRIIMNEYMSEEIPYNCPQMLTESFDLILFKFTSICSEVRGFSLFAFITSISRKLRTPSKNTSNYGNDRLSYYFYKQNHLQLYMKSLSS
ncbi:uncharacterized protein OCT59_019010 [Rhizophagus irregularis]|uniref:uncharacterized protein n=1 Tax=Rhizophagus irregularis TaxID=588596 RepID=UPI0019DCB00C|nr:hypothetical protein OCT59_019010 [Rhizophagus irregularis]GET62552.1 kinase-like domain-containing protein [Rhizophagus irregularis DAOM 181602=DAOM 197198]